MHMKYPTNGLIAQNRQGNEIYSRHYLPNIFRVTEALIGLPGPSIGFALVGTAAAQLSVATSPVADACQLPGKSFGCNLFVQPNDIGYDVR
ncbi:hypothetical protein D5078_06630 [Pectobacterium carotovorum]|nr:hypothetical protein D5078_06630 [Pectobacterium carotovorum]